MEMQIEHLADLAHIDEGALDDLFVQHLKAALRDLNERPAIKTARKIQLEMSMSPILSNTGTLGGVHADFEIKAKSPSFKTRQLSMACKEGKALVYNELAPDDHNQQTLDEIDSEKGSLGFLPNAQETG